MIDTDDPDETIEAKIVQKYNFGVTQKPLNKTKKFEKIEKSLFLLLF